ncbi:DegT/DnrJ/EryC1/StrS family aminotransferase [Pseudodesulfovibrio indicus]|uniref:DegT/DnrJ/EryC1/StrS aminotransferase n=1 Tax=Pseudodesulfovibrio indicus TaxID=1716143 RepID=A0A126QMA5_9BACT|nr:aminotransferase class I/II-fold pyridoxal phosphate-dependent enzyme [Pseudodesulfovibrio indicus]AMK11051.1 DegT/DnrJ/EryC1/StrS aminotransferase [Pseudodesulfovibrio indicus]TDT92061.1 dTDP-4-amino-4,6-dideoxygalactose transaminase [Pseudodesulfovibrio indicus]
MKKRVDDLALFGGQAEFASVRPIGQLAIGPEEIFFQQAKRIFEGRRLTNNGPLVRDLEARLSDLHQVSECVSFCSASLAIMALLRLLAEKGRTEVIMPAFTYPGLPHLARWAGLTPRFADILPMRHTLDPASVAEVASRDTAVVLAVHQVNSLCDVAGLKEVAGEYDIPVLYDSVHGVGCVHDGKRVGGHGVAEVFSLHATKIVNGFEGGYVTTNDAKLAEKLRLARNFGFAGQDAVSQCGFNGKLNELHAALALASLESVGDVMRGNRIRYEQYLRHFRSVPNCSFLRYAEDSEWNYEFVLLELFPDWKMSRDDVVDVMRRENALARPYYSPPLHLSPHMPEGQPVPSLPVTEQEAVKFIQMPVGELVDEDTIRRLAGLVAFVHDNQEEIAGRLAS